jgi:predicted ArsR family transcriptional regulator
MEQNINFQDISVLLHPIRFKLALTLIKSGEPMYLEQIAAELKKNPRLIAYHLKLLENHGFVSNEFKLIQRNNSKRGFAGKFFSATPKLKEALGSILGTGLLLISLDD